MNGRTQLVGLLFLFLLVPACSKAPEVPLADRAEVRRIADDIGSAAQRRDVSAVIQHLASDAQLSLAGTQHSVKTYEQHLQKIFPLISDYSYTKSKESMQLAANGSDVIFKFHLSEEYTFNNKRHSESHPETYFLRKEAGRFKIYKVLAE